MPLRKLVVNLISPSLKNASRHFAVRASSSSLLAWHKVPVVSSEPACIMPLRTLLGDETRKQGKFDSDIKQGIQKTFAREIVMSGKGLHSGVDVVARLVPAKAGEGRYFVVADHCSNIPANINYGLESALCTTLSKDGCRVRTVEHLLSALGAMGVDNCRVEMAPAIGCQWFSCFPVDEFVYRKDISSSRTFCIYEETKTMLMVGLIRGTSRKSALVCSANRGWLNPPLHFQYEPCRHKVLDLVGDLSLLAEDGSQGLPMAHVLVFKLQEENVVTAYFSNWC